MARWGEGRLSAWPFRVLEGRGFWRTARPTSVREWDSGESRGRDGLLWRGVWGVLPRPGLLVSISGSMRVGRPLCSAARARKLCGMEEPMVLRVDSGEPSSLCSVAPNPQTRLLQNDELISCLWSNQCCVKSTGSVRKRGAYWSGCWSPSAFMAQRSASEVALTS